MSKGTILYIGGFELPDKNAAAQRVVGIGNALKVLGYNVVFIGIHKNKDKKPEKTSCFGFDVYQLPYPKSKAEWLKQIMGVREYLQIASNIPTLTALILYNFPAIPMLRLMHYFRKTDVRIIADCTEWPQSSKFEGVIRHCAKSIDTALRMRWVHFKVDHVIAISRYLHDFYSSRGQASSYIPPLVDLADKKWTLNFDSVKSGANSLSCVYAGSPYDVGDPTAKDRLDLLVTAINSAAYQVPGFRFSLDVVGVTKENYLDRYPNLIQLVENFNGNLTFHGRLSHEQSLNRLKLADFMVFFRDDNLVSRAGFPTKFVEAVSCAVATITNVDTNVSDYIEHGKNGFLLSDSLEEDMVSVLADISAWSRADWLELGRVTADSRSTFDYRNFLNQIEAVVDGVPG